MAIHQITLTYNADPENLTSDVKAKKITAGDSLEFVSNAGPVRVLMIPGDQFSAGEFRSGDEPVTATVAQPFRFCCGVNIAGKVVGYPLHQRFGDSGEIKSGGSGTKEPTPAT